MNKRGGKDTAVFLLAHLQSSKIAMASGGSVLGFFLNLNMPLAIKVYGSRQTYLKEEAQTERNILSSTFNVLGGAFCLSPWYKYLVDTYGVVQILSIFSLGATSRSYAESCIARSTYPRR
jgi:hypothetical protein